MSSHFIALPVGQGDAFIMERRGKRVLVDGGKSGPTVCRLVSDNHVAHLDVVVCTHNDKDHAEGVAGLLEGEVCSFGEVWLPGRWSERLLDLCQASEEFMRELADAVNAADARNLEAASREPPSDTQEARREARTGNTDDAQNSLHADEQERRLLDAIDSMDDAGGVPWWPHHFGTKSWSLWIDCVNAAGRIRRIAKAARDVGAKVRWFDYAEFRDRGIASGGQVDLLVPVNSVEITPRIAGRRLGALEFLRLSVANAESLVFHAPPAGADPEVLFSADSDLSFPLPVRDGALVTAPHHGSEGNVGAYGQVAASAKSVVWVRSDGRFQKRPGTTFLEQPVRYCTRCRGGTGPGQAVRMDAVGGPGELSWRHSEGVATCGCSSE